MANRPPAGSSVRTLATAALAAAVVACAAQGPAFGAESTAEEIAVKAAAAFGKLDVAPCDGVLTGAEMATVGAYDRDGDARVTPEEFARGYLEKKPDIEWLRHEFKREGFACEMPGTPEPFAEGGAARFQVAADVADGDALLIARTRDMPARAAGKPDPFFDSVVEMLEASGAEVVDRRAANIGLHRGSLVLAVREDGTREYVRSVVVGRTVYELDAVLSPDADAAGEEVVNRFLASLRIVNDRR